MNRAIVSFFVSAVLCVAGGVVGGASPAAAADRLPPLMLGPGDAGVHDIGGKAIIRMSKFGYVYIAGQQHSHLRVKFIKERNSLRYRDTGGTHTVASMPSTCERERVKKGISVVCKIPKSYDRKRMFVQVWPRLGNDYVDGRTLPRRFRLWVLTDDGNDVVYGGDGNDFVNGAMGNDRVYGGAGNDWLRGGPGGDRITGGPGNNRVSHN